MSHTFHQESHEQLLHYWDYDKSAPPNIKQAGIPEGDGITKSLSSWPATPPSTPIRKRSPSQEYRLAELGFEPWFGDPADIKTQRVRKQKTDRHDATEFRRRDYTRALVVDEEFSTRAKWCAPRRGRNSMLKKDLTDPTLLEMERVRDHSPKTAIPLRPSHRIPACGGRGAERVVKTFRCGSTIGAPP